MAIEKKIIEDTGMYKRVKIHATGDDIELVMKAYALDFDIDVLLEWTEAAAANAKPEDRDAVRNWLEHYQRAVAAADMNYACAAAWHLGQLAERMGIRPAELKVKAIADARKEGPKERKRLAADRYAEWQRRADRIWKRHPDRSVLDVASDVADATGYSVTTIRHHIRKPAK